MIFNKQLYQIARFFLFHLDPELAHHSALRLLSLLPSRSPSQTCPTTVMGIDFPNPVGIAAGFDKDGRYINALAGLGAGHVEVGTVTPLPQAGHPQPRIWRLRDEKALLNRMGFPNKGVKALNVGSPQCIVGVSIGQGKDGSLEDYAICFKEVDSFADYVTLNVSSPNTEGLRDLQYRLSSLAESVFSTREEMSSNTPIAIKIAPDLPVKQVISSLELFDAIVATNTYPVTKGGLSGKPLTEKALGVVKELRELTDKPIIGVGGIMTPEDAIERLQFCDLIQLYTGLVYYGPSLIDEILEALCEKG